MGQILFESDLTRRVKSLTRENRKCNRQMNGRTTIGREGKREGGLGRASHLGEFPLSGSPGGWSETGITGHSCQSLSCEVAGGR